MKIKKYISSFYFKLFETCLIMSTKFSTCNNKTLSNIVMAKVLITEKKMIYEAIRELVLFFGLSPQIIGQLNWMHSYTEEITQFSDKSTHIDKTNYINICFLGYWFWYFKKYFYQVNAWCCMLYFKYDNIFFHSVPLSVLFFHSMFKQHPRKLNYICF